jgi:hypothetical protein
VRRARDRLIAGLLEREIAAQHRHAGRAKGGQSILRLAVARRRVDRMLLTAPLLVRIAAELAHDRSQTAREFEQPLVLLVLTADWILLREHECELPSAGLSRPDGPVSGAAKRAGTSFPAHLHRLH